MSYNQFKPFAPATARRASASDAFFVDASEPLYLVGGVTGVFGCLPKAEEVDTTDLHCALAGDRIDAAPLGRLVPADAPERVNQRSADSRHAILAPNYLND